jgi:hypothetical protein
MNIPNIYIGPFGQAQLFAIEFEQNMLKAQAIMEVLSKLESLEMVLENKDILDVEKKLATKLIDELHQCLLDINGVTDDQARNGKVSKVFN